MTTMSKNAQGDGTTFSIIAFGNVEGPQGIISGDTIFRELFAKSRWYTARASQAATPGTRVLFYQNGRGFRGTALIEGAQKRAITTLAGRGLYMTFQQELILQECATFSEPLDIRPIINDLEFIANKRYWGHSFRSTPRRISATDYHAIVTLCPSQPTATLQENA